MKTFKCQRCGNRVFFENVLCLACKAVLGFDDRTLLMTALEPVDDGLFRPVNAARDRVRYCANAAHGVCNWLTRTPDAGALCTACGLNRTIPNLAQPGNLAAWAEFELAKKRLIYGLFRFGLPLGAAGDGGSRLTFDFAHGTSTGHLDGVITVDAREADSVEREKQRKRFDEPYRSLLGHLRHESGHYYWGLLVDGGDAIAEFRALFGDERSDYRAALDRHYASGPPADWQDRFVSAYASVHPWEDWAETWAHYLHIASAVDTAEATGMEPRASGIIFGGLWPFKSYDVYREETFEALMERWIPLTIAMNDMTRSMGHGDFYPFVVPAAAHAKLAFVHRVIRRGARR